MNLLTVPTDGGPQEERILYRKVEMANENLDTLNALSALML